MCFFTQQEPFVTLKYFPCAVKNTKCMINTLEDVDFSRGPLLVACDLHISLFRLVNIKVKHCHHSNRLLNGRTPFNLFWTMILPKQNDSLVCLSSQLANIVIISKAKLTLYRSCQCSLLIYLY